jgi:predicted nuclease with TOPRIM domain
VEFIKNLNQFTMRIIFCLILLVLCTTVFSQNEKPPTKEEMKADFEQSIREAKQQRDDLIAQIAEAKKNNEDAESISEMEKQLTTMNQMISMLEKSNPFATQPAKILPVVKNTEPAYVSPFTPIKLKQPVSKPTWAQATDQLLWYRGRRIDANTLITPSGLIARYNQQQHLLTLQPDRTDTPYYNLVNTLGQLRQMRLDYSSRMDGMMNSFFLFPLIEDAYNEYEFFKERYYKIAENTFQIGTPQGNVSLEQYIYNLGNYIQSLPPARSIPPPKRANDLCVCDYAAARRKYENDLKDWKDKFLAEENKILEELSKIVGLIQHFRNNNHSLSSTVSLFEENFHTYRIKYLERLNTKLSELANQYPTDVLIEDGLVLISSVINKHMTEIDGWRSTFANVRAAIEGTLFRVKTLVMSDIFDNYIEEQKRLKDYNKVFDFGLYTAHEFNKSRVQPNYQVNKKLFDTWIKGVEKFNRFKMNIEIDFEYRQVDPENRNYRLLYATGALSSDDTYVSLGRWECKWELYMTDQNHRNRNTGGEEFRIPMKVLAGGENNYVTNKSLRYSGPAYMRLVFPTFKINLCGNQSVAMLDVLGYSAADLKAHARDRIEEVYTTQMQQYVNKVLTGARKTEINAPELMSKAIEMMNMNNQQRTQAGSDPAYNRLKTEHSMNRKKADLQFGTSNITHTANTVIPLVKTMPAPIILFDPEVTLDNSTDEDNKKYGLETKATIKIKIVHAPR